MVILIDSREKRNTHIKRYFAANNIKFATSKLYVGDYQRADNGQISIDKKFGLQEVYGCVVPGWKRFAAECRRAQEAGITLIVLTEDERITSLPEVSTWENPRIKEWEKAREDGETDIPSLPPISSKRIEARMRTLSKRYGVKWKFCRKEDAGKTIYGILSGETLC